MPPGKTLDFSILLINDMKLVGMLLTFILLTKYSCLMAGFFSRRSKYYMDEYINVD
jgi:hypothetical protein